MTAPAVTAPRRIAILGAGGHAKVVAEAAIAAGFAVAGFVDGGEPGRLVLGLPVLGPDSDLAGLAAAHGIGGAIVGIGANRLRLRLGGLVRAAGLELVSVISPAAVVSPTARIGAGTLVMPRAVINAEARIGEGVIVNTGAIVEHDCVIGEGVHCAPGSIALGGVTIGAGTLLGAGATALPGVRIGAGATVGTGAAVIRDIPDGVTATGVPARPQRAAGG